MRNYFENDTTNVVIHKASLDAVSKQNVPNHFGEEGTDADTVQNQRSPYHLLYNSLKKPFTANNSACHQPTLYHAQFLDMSNMSSLFTPQRNHQVPIVCNMS